MAVVMVHVRVGDAAEVQLLGRAARIVRYVADRHEDINRMRLGQLQFDFAHDEIKVQLRESATLDLPSSHA